MSQAEALGFHGAQLHHIGVASILHDVGKLFIPDEILSKPAALTPEERRIMETHALQGYRYLMENGRVPKLSVLSALEHHIKYDGSGYPHFKKGWQPSIVSQMVAIADVFDAMRSRRAYQGPRPLDIILGVLNKGKGSDFNPLLVNNFLKLIMR